MNATLEPVMPHLTVFRSMAVRAQFPGYVREVAILVQVFSFCSRLKYHRYSLNQEQLLVWETIRLQRLILANGLSAR